MFQKTIQRISDYRTKIYGSYQSTRNLNFKAKQNMDISRLPGANIYEAATGKSSTMIENELTREDFE